MTHAQTQLPARLIAIGVLTILKRGRGESLQDCHARAAKAMRQLSLIVSKTMKILVVYYSRSGYTARVASALAAQCKGQIEQLRSVDLREGWRGYMRSAMEAITKAAPPIRLPQHKPELFDLVIIGTPVWAQNMASPVRSYLATHAARLSRVAFFCTMGGTGDARTFRELARVCGRSPQGNLALTDAEIDAGRHHGKIDQFVHALHAAESRTNGVTGVLTNERI